MTIRDLLAEHMPDDDDGTTTPPAPLDAAPDRPDYLLPKFETPEAQARAYAAAEAEMGRLRAENDRREREFSEALSQIEAVTTPPAQQFPQGQDPTLVAYGRALEEGDYATALAIQQMVNQASTQQTIREELANFAPQLQQASGVSRDVAMRLAEQEVAPRYGDRWGEIAPKVEEQIRSKPGLLPEQGSVETFAAIIDSEARLVEYERLQADARRAEQERQDKLAAQTLGGDTVRVPTDTDEKKAEWQQVVAADTGEVPW